MGYRNDADCCHKPKPHRTVQKTTTPGTFYITNGQEARLAFPCWYKEIYPPLHAQHHCRQTHDHYGWPSPSHPDHSCQEHDFAHFTHPGCCDASHRHGIASHHERKHDGIYHFDNCGDYIDLNKMHPIHLSGEGYEAVTVQVGEAKAGLAAKGWIDEKQDWVIRVWFKANIADLEEPYETKLAIRVGNTKLNKVDTVFLGRLVVLPAAMVTLTGGN